MSDPTVAYAEADKALEKAKHDLLHFGKRLIEIGTAAWQQPASLRSDNSDHSTSTEAAMYNNKSVRIERGEKLRTARRANQSLLSRGTHEEVGMECSIA
jgi:hypothetical protein